ncbi:hypothetical protein B0H11DRAFT_2063477 [Mycena galericulata]|nr:hypothetical protein B0H11DRAFT_2063477 [Mycena galericulata]
MLPWPARKKGFGGGSSPRKSKVCCAPKYAYPHCQNLVFTSCTSNRSLCPLRRQSHLTEPSLGTDSLTIAHIVWHTHGPSKFNFDHVLETFKTGPTTCDPINDARREALTANVFPVQEGSSVFIRASTFNLIVQWRIMIPEPHSTSHPFESGSTVTSRTGAPRFIKENFLDLDGSTRDRAFLSPCSGSELF